MKNLSTYTFRGNPEQQAIYESTAIKGSKIKEIFKGEQRKLMGIFQGVLYATIYDGIYTDQYLFFS